MDGFNELFDLIVVLARRRYQAAEQHFAAIGLNHTEARLMTLLNEAGGNASQDAISAELVLDRSNAGRGLKRLEQAGYLRRRKDRDDKRCNRVEITAKGKGVVREIARIRAEIVQDFFGSLSEAEARHASGLLRKALLDA